MRRTGRHKRIWEIGGLVVLIAIAAAWGVISVNAEMQNRALASAVENGDEEKASELIRQGANINAHSPITRQTPLMRAVISGNDGLTRELLRRGARLNATSRGGSTALMIASGRSFQTTKLLLAKGADPHLKDGLGQGALSCAVQSGELDIVRLLIGQGCDPCDRDVNAENAFGIAHRCGNTQMVRLLRRLDRSLHSK